MTVTLDHPIYGKLTVASSFITGDDVSKRFTIMRTTHTTATLEVAQTTIDDIIKRLDAAGAGVLRDYYDDVEKVVVFGTVGLKAETISPPNLATDNKTKMKTTMRALLTVAAVIPFTGGETVQMHPVCGKAPFGPAGESEENSYSRWTPSGKVELSITNPELCGKFKQGQQFYANFEEVEAPAESAAPESEAPPAVTGEGSKDVDAPAATT